VKASRNINKRRNPNSISKTTCRSGVKDRNDV
jgi:hypothetical protein